MRAKLIAFLFGALVVQQNYAAAAVGYAFQDLGIPEPLSKLQRGANGGGINDAGEIVVTTDSVGNLRSPQAYRYASGEWQQLPPLGSDPALPYKIATGINNSGDIVGGSMIGRDSNDQPTYTPVMWQGSSVTDLAPTGLTQANAINDAGTIMGGNSVYVAGSLQALGFTARALNNNNEVVGFLPTPSISLPYYWSPVTGAQQLFPLQPNQTASLTDINDGGIVTGWTNTNATFDHAFYYDGAVHDLNSLIGGNRSQAFGINNAGAIVGSSDRGFWVYKGGQVLFLADYLPDRPDFGPRLLQNFLGINNAGRSCLPARITAIPPARCRSTSTCLRRYPSLPPSCWGSWRWRSSARSPASVVEFARFAPRRRAAADSPPGSLHGSIVPKAGGRLRALKGTYVEFRHARSETATANNQP